MSSAPSDRGCLKTLCRFSIPMMLTFLSMNMMVFFDRLFLSRYSIQALNDVICGGNLCWALSFPWIILIDITEVFVARYNGSQKFAKIGEIVWQMVWLTLPIACLFFLVGNYGGYWLMEHHLFESSGERHYFQWCCYFVPGLTLFSAIASFFTGRGQTFVVAALVIIANVINIVLDYVLIFGFRGIIPPLGLDGALIATGAGVTFQACAILVLFLRKKNREHFGLKNLSVNLPLTLEAIKLGAPTALLMCFEILGWTVFLWMMKEIGPSHLLVAGICQSIMHIFLCFGSGLEAGTIGLVGNLIGAGRHHEVKKTFRSGLLLILFFTIFLILVLVVKPQFFIGLFTQHSSEEIIFLLKPALILVAIYLTCENIRWLLKGLLIAAGDTQFLMKAGALAIWFLLVLPIYLFVFLPKASILTALYFWIFYSCSITVISYLRFLFLEKNGLVIPMAQPYGKPST